MFKRLKNKLSQRRDKIIEGRIKDMVSRGEGYAVFDEIYYDSARGYAIDRGAKAADATSASTRIEIDGKVYSVVFSKSAGGGTVFGVDDAQAVRDRLLNPAKMKDHLDDQLKSAFSQFSAEQRYEQAERNIAKDIENGVEQYPSWIAERDSVKQLLEVAVQAALKAGMSENLALHWLEQNDVTAGIYTSAAHFEKVGFGKAEQVKCTGKFIEKLAKGQLRAQQRQNRD